MRPAQFLATVFAVSSLTAAWPYPDAIDYKGVGDFILLGRDQNNGGNNNPPNNSPNNSPAPGHGGDTQPTRTQPPSNHGDQTNKPKSTDKPKSSDAPKGKGDDKHTTTAAETKSYALSAGFGGVKLITPAATSGLALYKVGEYVTFSWNYTSMKAPPPPKIDVLASCSLNQNIYTITANASGSDTEVVWDTEKQAEGVSPLPMASYTLIIKDSEDEISATARPGYLGVYSGLVFAMYTTTGYTDYADWNCATCRVNAGIAVVPAHQTLTFLVGMATMTVLSFTYFASNRFGVF